MFYFVYLWAGINIYKYTMEMGDKNERLHKL